jgi:hypothetical protein
VAGVVAVAVELQAGLRVPLPPSIQVLVVNCSAADIVEVVLQERHFAVRCVTIPLDDGVGGSIYGRGDIEVRVE